MGTWDDIGTGAEYAFPVFALANSGVADMAGIDGIGSGKKNAPASQDYKGAAEAQSRESRFATEQQTRNNRPNQSTPWANNTWQQNPDGSWVQNTGFNGPLSGAAYGLQNQFAQANANPLDFSGLGKLSTGEDARNQAIDSAYKQASSRLDPQWDQRQQQMRAQLAAQGLDNGSQAAQMEMGNFGRDRNDAYSSAMNGAIGQGTAAGQAIFNQSLAGRQQGINEMMAQRNNPLQQLQGLQGFLSMPGFNAANAWQPPDYLGAAAAKGNYDMSAWQGENQAKGDMMGGLGSLAGGAMMAFSDERLKDNIKRLSVDALPGVPFATYEFKNAPGRTHLGVIAQDLEKVAPHLVAMSPDGFRLVDYSGIPFFKERK